MYKKILVPMALDHGVSSRTLEIARILAAPDGEIVALHVYEAAQGSASAYLDDKTVANGLRAAQTLLAQKLSGKDDVSSVVLKGHAARTILDYAAQGDFDCIVIASHMPGLSDYLLGSTAARVVRHAGCAVHVHRARD